MEIGIEDIDDYRGRFRMRSERRRKRAAKEAYDKELLRMDREQNAVQMEVRNLGWEDLATPVQRGYVRFFVLRDDVKRSRQGRFFEKLLEKINHRQYSHRKDFLEKKRRHGKKVYVPREHTLRRLSCWHRSNMKFTPEEWAYFTEEKVYDEHSRLPRIVYCFTEPWRYRLRIQPNMITKVRVQDVDLERREADIERYFQFDNRSERRQKLLDGNTFKWARYLGKPDKPNYKNPLMHRSLSDILSEHYPEPTLRITCKDPQSPGDFFWISRCSANGIPHKTIFGHIRRVGIEPSSTTAPNRTGVLKKNRQVYPLYPKNLVRYLSNYRI